MIVQVRLSREEIEQMVLDAAALRVDKASARSIEYFSGDTFGRDSQVDSPFDFAVVVVTSD